MKNKIKQLGQIFTPQHIAQRMIKQANPNINMSVIEPSCGNGVFVIEFLNYFYENKISISEIQQWIETKLLAIDIDDDLIHECQQNIHQWFSNHGVENINLSNIQCKDALSLPNHFHFDLCIGNPPYVQAKHMEDEQLKHIKQKFKSCEKYKPNLYYAFIEKFFHLCNRLLFIVPNSFMSNLSGKYIHELVVKHSVSNLVDFYQIKQFDNADTYTCIIDLSKHTSNDISLSNNNKIDIGYSLPPNWKLSEHQMVCLATLANKTYYIDENDIPKNEFKIAISNGIVRKQIDGKDNQQWIIFPYQNGKLINENDFQLQYPTIYQHLEKHKSILGKRDKNKGKDYPCWFQYGRSQGVNNPELPINSQLLFFGSYYYPNKCEPKFIQIDNNQYQYTLKSGIAIIIKSKEELRFWQAFVKNVDVWRYLLYNTQIISGGYYQLRTSKIKEVIKLCLNN